MCVSASLSHPTIATVRLSRERHAQRYAWSRQQAAPHQKDVDGSGGAAPFVDGPYDQRLAAAAVAAGEDFRGARGELAIHRLVVAALVVLQAEQLRDILLRTTETQGQQHQVGRPGPLG